MGTRNLTCVIKNKKFVTAKYCQWDGYPNGQGQTIIHFLTDGYEPVTFSKHLENSVTLSPDEISNRWRVNGADGSDFVSQKVVDSFIKNNDHLSRDIGGGKFLLYIQETETPEFPPKDLSFAKDSLFCEWCYVLDLDTNRFEVYKGFNKTPLTSEERFFFLQHCKDEYYPVKFLVGFEITPNLEAEWASWLQDYNKEEIEE